MFLTCANSTEAEKIASKLLESKLVFCVKKSPVSSSFLWKGKIDNSEEILLIMDSLEDNFQKVKEVVQKLHSYETFVLVSVPISQTTDAVKDWATKELSS